MPTEPGEWRRFNGDEIFALLICAEMRAVYGIPGKRLRWLHKKIVEEPNRLVAILKSMHVGLSVYIWTDLKKIFVIEPDIDVQKRLGGGALSENEHFILFNLNGLVRRLAAAAQQKIEVADLTLHDLIHAYNEMTQKYSALNQSEREVLDLIRDERYKSVTVILKDGQAIRADAETSLSATQLDAKALQAIIKSHAFQTVSVTQRDGTTVHLSTKQSVKLTQTPKR